MENDVTNHTTHLALKPAHYDRQLLKNDQQKSEKSRGKEGRRWSGVMNGSKFIMPRGICHRISIRCFGRVCVFDKLTICPSTCHVVQCRQPIVSPTRILLGLDLTSPLPSCSLFQYQQRPIVPSGTRSLVGVCQTQRKNKASECTPIVPNCLHLTAQITSLARNTASDPNEALLTELRELEKKMGLVLTLVSLIAALDGY